MKEKMLPKLKKAIVQRANDPYYLQGVQVGMCLMAGCYSVGFLIGSIIKKTSKN